MSPPLPVHNSRHVSVINAEFPRDGSHRRSFGPPLPHRPNDVVRQACACCSFAPSSTISRDRFRHVFLMGTFAKMRRVAARSVIARMEDVRRPNARREKMRNFMGEPSFPIVPEQAITRIHLRPKPRPALIGGTPVDLLPESFRKRATQMQQLLLIESRSSHIRTWNPAALMRRLKFSKVVSPK